MYVCMSKTSKYCVYFNAVDVYMMSKGLKLKNDTSIPAVRTVAAGHRMIADGWGMFKEAVNQAGAGDLPQLLRSIRSMTTPPPATPPPVLTTPPLQGPLATPPPTLMDVQGPSPQTVKQEANNEEPILIRVGGEISYFCPQCETITISKNGCDAHIRAVHTGKALRCAYCAFSTYNRDLLNRHQREHN